MARMGHDGSAAALIYQHATSEADQAIAAALDAQIGMARPVEDPQSDRANDADPEDEWLANGPGGDSACRPRTRMWRFPDLSGDGRKSGAPAITANYGWESPPATGARHTANGGVVQGPPGWGPGAGGVRVWVGCLAGCGLAACRWPESVEDDGEGSVLEVVVPAGVERALACACQQPSLPRVERRRGRRRLVGRGPGGLRKWGRFPRAPAVRSR